MRLIAIPLLAASALFCQDAKIIIVERHDTTSLKSAYAEYKAAQAKWEKVKTEVAKKYTTEKSDKVGCPTPVNGTCEKTMDGWEKVEFSVDFRALVPQRTYSSNITWAYPLNAGTTSTLGLGTAVASDLAVSSDSIRADLKTKDGTDSQQ